MAVEDTLVWPLMTELLECLCTEVGQTPGGAPCFCGLVPGAFNVMDYCDCTGTGCGMAFVRLDRMYPSRSLPVQSNDFRSCNDPLAVRLETGVFRCLPGMNERGEPPTVDEQNQAVWIQMCDRQAMYRAIVCCVGIPRARPAILDAYRPQGPLGNCGGGVWAVTIQLGVM